MAAARQTLLAKLQPMFKNRTENVAVAALEHILSGSDAARCALSDVIAAGGASVGQIAQIQTESRGERGTRPDLAGLDQQGEERVLIEAKFWADLTENQPTVYLRRLPANKPSALLFVAPETRCDELWTQLRRTVSTLKSGITLGPNIESPKLWGATAGGMRYLMLTSWTNLLDRMEATAAAPSDSENVTVTDIRQLRGLTEQETAGRPALTIIPMAAE